MMSIHPNGIGNGPIVPMAERGIFHSISTQKYILHQNQIIATAPGRNSAQYGHRRSNIVAAGP